MQKSMKKEVIGILVCTFLISVAVAPAMNALNIEENEINEAEDPPQPKPNPWPPYDECVGFGFGRIYNLKEEWTGWSPYSSFNCENAIVRLGIYGEEEHWHHYTNGEKVYVYNVRFFHNRNDNFFLVLY